MTKNYELVYIVNTIFKLMTKLIALQIAELMAQPMQYFVTSGLRAGHIPGSLNLPINSLLDKETGKLKSAETLQKLFDEAGFDMGKPTVTTCGPGVTAAGLTLALAILGKTDIRLFDGSWSQWGSSDAPIEK